MKILYVGNFTQKHCTEVHLARTLEKLGHEVVRLQENELSHSWVTDHQNGADLFLFTRTWGGFVMLDDLNRLRSLGIPTVSYHLDLYVGLSRKYLHGPQSLDQVLQTDPFWRTDFVFTPDGDPESAKVFKKNGVQHYYMKPGVFEDECNMVPPSFIEQKSVLFVGGGDRVGSSSGYGHPEWPYRDRLITWLYDTYGTRFSKFGHPQETIRNDELNQLYANHKVVVGDSVCINFNHMHYWSDRVYETIGRGGFMIHPYIRGMEEEFEDGKHIVFYKFGDFDDLKRKIDYYLEHDEEREAIRRAGHEMVKSNCTYTQRMQKMIETVQAVGITRAAEAVPTPSSAAPVKINLGAGSELKEGFINCDWLQLPGIEKVFNLLNFPWPFDDQSADEISAHDVLEHMPPFTNTGASFPISFVEEAHRILRPGGKLFIQVPHWQSRNLWIDLTHVRGYDEKSMDYFDPEKDLGKWYGYYSRCKFSVNAVRTPNDNVEFTMIKL